MHAVPADDPASRGAARSLLCPSLIGRDRELAELREVTDQRTAVHVAALVGDAGLGKSALIRAALAPTRRTVLEGRATPDSPELRVLAEIATAAVAAGACVDDPALNALRGGLVALLPGTGDAELTGGTYPLIAAEALLALIETIGRPVTLVLEDLHWADRDSLEAIERIGDRVAARAITVVMATRPDGRAERLVRRLGTRRVATVLDLSPLDSSNIIEMASACLDGPAPAGIDDLLAAAAGKPYLVEELLRTASDVGALTANGAVWSFDPTTPVPAPATLTESVALRLRQMPAETAYALCVAAALGERLPTEVIVAAADLEHAAVNVIVRAGIAAQLLDSGSVDIRFRHALSAEAAASVLLPSERRDAAARGLAAATGDQGLSGRIDPTAIASLAEQAGDLDAAARWRLAAGRKHAETAAVTAAIAELEQALRLTQDPRLLGEIRIETVELLALAGRDNEAIALAEVAANAPQLSVDDQVRIDVARARCATARSARDAAIANAVIHAQGRPLEARVAATAALLAVEQGDHDAATDHATRALNLGASDPTARCQALEALGRVARGRDLDEARDRFTSAAAVAEAHGLTLWGARALHERATIAQLRDGDIADLRAARASAIAAGAPGLIAAIDFHLAAVLAVRFEGPDALDAARRFLDLSSALANRSNEAWGWILVGQANIASGRPKQAEPALAEAARLHPDNVEITTLAHFMSKGFARLLAADLDSAADGYRDAMTALSASASTLSPLPPWYLGPLLATITDRDGDAVRRLTDRADLQVATTIRAPWLFAEAVAAGRGGDRDRANHFVGQADMLWNGKPGLDGLRHLAHWLAAPAAHQDQWGDPHRWLFETETWAADHRFQAIADSCRARLRATGALPKRRRGSTAIPDGLRQLGITSREVDVLTLVARGLTNAEVAEHLHLSPGTIKGYVSQLLAKTATSNRAGLARIAADHQLDHRS